MKTENIFSGDLSSQNTQTVATPTSLKFRNRVSILQALRSVKCTTVNNISDITGISRQTIVKSMAYFMDNKIILDLGKGSSTEVGGKRPQLYKINPAYKYILCLRFENYRLVLALYDSCAMEVASVSKVHRENAFFQIILDDFSQLYRELLQSTRIAPEDIYGLGICVSGICDKNTGIMRYNSLYSSWGQDVDFVNSFKALLPDNINIMVANDSKMTGIAEICYNKDLESKNFVALYTHNGISAAFIGKGQLRTGVNSLLGEIGHTTVDVNSDVVCGCGSKGCFENEVSLSGLLRQMDKIKDNYSDSILLRLDAITIEDIFKLSDDGDRLACALIDYCSKYFASILRNIILYTDPEMIIIQGIYAHSSQYFKTSLKAKMSDFKYYPKNEIPILYDKREICQLALTGLCHVMADSLFADSKIYNN